MFTLKCGITLPSHPEFGRALSQLSAILGPEQRIDITFLPSPGVPGRAAFCSAFLLPTTPSERERVRPGLLLLADLASR